MVIKTKPFHLRLQWHGVSWLAFCYYSDHGIWIHIDSFSAIVLPTQGGCLSLFLIHPRFNDMAYLEYFLVPNPSTELWIIFFISHPQSSSIAWCINLLLQFCPRNANVYRHSISTLVFRCMVYLDWFPVPITSTERGCLSSFHIHLRLQWHGVS